DLAHAPAEGQAAAAVHAGLWVDRARIRGHRRLYSRPHAERQSAGSVRRRPRARGASMRSSALAAGLARGGVLLHAFGGACQVTSPTTETTIDAPALEYLRRRHLERRLAEIFGSAKQRGGSRAEERGTRARAARL